MRNIFYTRSIIESVIFTLTPLFFSVSGKRISRTYDPLSSSNSVKFLIENMSYYF